MKKLIIAMLLAIWLLGLSACQTTYKTDWKAKYGALSISYSELKKENQQLKNQVTGLNQQVEQLTIKYIADEMFINDLEDKYKILLTYATVAESILRANNIDYTILQGIEGEE